MVRIEFPSIESDRTQEETVRAATVTRDEALRAAEEAAVRTEARAGRIHEASLVRAEAMREATKARAARLKEVQAAEDEALRQAAAARTDAILESAQSYDETLRAAVTAFDEAMWAAEVEAADEAERDYAAAMAAAEAEHVDAVAAAEATHAGAVARARRLKEVTTEHVETIWLATTMRAENQRQVAGDYDTAVRDCQIARGTALRELSAQQDEALRAAQRAYDEALSTIDEEAGAFDQEMVRGIAAEQPAEGVIDASGADAAGGAAWEENSGQADGQGEIATAGYDVDLTGEYRVDLTGEDAARESMSGSAQQGDYGDSYDSER